MLFSCTPLRVSCRKISATRACISLHLPTSTARYSPYDTGCYIRAVATSNSTCSNGLVGVENNMGTVCCVLGCDPCGGDGCATNNTMVASNCCAGEISELCSVTNSAPCKLEREYFHCAPSGHFLHSRISPIENIPFRLESSGPSPYRQSSRFYSFCVLPRGGWCAGVLLYSSRNRLAALSFALSPRATAGRTLVPASWWLWAWPKAAKSTFVELHSTESRQSYSRRSRCWQHGIDTARCCRRVMHAAGERNLERSTLTCCEKQRQ